MAMMYCICGQSIELIEEWNGHDYIKTPTEHTCPRCGEWTGGKLLVNAPRADLLSIERDELIARIVELERALERIVAAQPIDEPGEKSYLREAWNMAEVARAALRGQGAEGAGEKGE